MAVAVVGGLLSVAGCSSYVNGYKIEPGAELVCANLSGAELGNRDLCGSDLPGRDLTGANLSGQPFDETNLRAACGPCNSRLGGRLGNLRKALATDGHGVTSCPICGGRMVIDMTTDNETPPEQRRTGRAAVGMSGPF